MKTYIVKERTVVKKTHDKTFCDKCNAEINIDQYDAFECDITLKTGSQYPEGGSGDRAEIDLCPHCSESLFKSLEADGYRINIEEWDF